MHAIGHNTYTLVSFVMKGLEGYKGWAWYSDGRKILLLLT